MTRYGIDYAFSKPSPSAIRSAGYTFACRYLGGSASKDLTKSEATALRAAGVDVVANWESTADHALSGKAAGVADAKAALSQANAAGIPAGRPIYFSVDFNIKDYAPSSSDPRAKLGPVAAYFDGVISVLGLARTGGYGGYWAVKRLFDAGLIRWGWQTYAWSGGQWDGRAHIRQIKNGITVGGADCDKDQAMQDDFGQWGYAPTAQTEEDDVALRQDPDGVYLYNRVQALAQMTAELDGPEKDVVPEAVTVLKRIDANAAAAAKAATSTGGLTDDDRAAIKALTDAVNGLAHQLASP